MVAALRHHGLCTRGSLKTLRIRARGILEEDTPQNPNWKTATLCEIRDERARCVQLCKDLDKFKIACPGSPIVYHTERALRDAECRVGELCEMYSAWKATDADNEEIYGFSG